MAAAKKKNNPLSKKAEWTITEFQMWLAGAYSLQGEDWVPNAEQWEMIVDIIYKLKSKAQPAQQQQRPMPMQHQHQQPVIQHQPQPEGQMPRMDAGSSLLMGDTNLPPEASMSLSKLRQRSGMPGPVATGLAGDGKPGEKEIRTGGFE